MTKWQKYVPPEQRTETEIRKEIEREFTRWNYIAQHGCADPFGTDGENMNLVRNHIIYRYRILAEREIIQLNLFGEVCEERPIPPEVPDRYMVKGGEHEYRVKLREPFFQRLVWGYPGQYHA